MSPSIRDFIKICQLWGTEGGQPSSRTPQYAHSLFAPVGADTLLGDPKQGSLWSLKAFIQIPPLSQRAVAASSRGPGVGRAAPTRGPSLSFQGRSWEAMQRLPKQMSPSWPHTSLATYCPASEGAREPPGSPLPNKQGQGSL